MKKILTIFAIILMAIAAKAEDVSTPKDFLDAIQSNKDVTLIMDIDIQYLSAIASGDAEGCLCDTYTGTLNGNGYALKNGKHPLFYSLSGATVEDITLDGFTLTDVNSAIAVNTANSTFSHITVKNSSLTANNAGDGSAATGMIAGTSDNDRFEYCTVSSGCTVTSKEWYVGGIAGYAIGDDGCFSHCYNGASVTAEGTNHVGGIAGGTKVYLYEYCLNTGYIGADDKVGGILGSNERECRNSTSCTHFNNCVNTGLIACDSHLIDYETGGGILGYSDDKCYASFNNCMNFGTVKHTNEPFCGYKNKSLTKVFINDCYYYFGNGAHENLSEAGITYTELMSGEYAYSQSWLYQDLDNNTFATKYPVPVSDAGTVKKNVLCNGDVTYSNKYGSTASHTTQEKDGYCTTCGIRVVHLSTPEDLQNFSAELKAGTTFRYAKVILDNDIDLSSVSAISSGDEEGYLLTSFTGIFEGNNHTLKNCSHALFYRTNHANIENLTLEGFAVTDQPSLIARTSYKSTFYNITVKNSSIVHTSDDMNNFGMIVGYSDADEVSYCTVESDCYITTNRRQVGGIAGKSYKGTISNCCNSATITADADYVGGIVGYCGDSDNAASTIESCLNTGTINGDGECAGIAGHYYNGTITHCVNTGTISSEDGGTHENVGGIVGKLYSATCNNCINFGSVDKAKSSNSQFAIYGGKDGTITATGNEYYCYVKGKHFDTGMTYADILSGKYAMTKNSNGTWLNQNIDRGVFTATAYPVPLYAAGVVHSNILCDGTQSYSNIYQSTGAHTSNLNANGICTTCGAQHISTADDLVAFANTVNNGTVYVSAILDNDIDLSGKEFPMIGNSSSHPFRGVFSGQAYRIKNMSLSYAQDGVGLFGTVSGSSTIKNVIIDSSCSVTSTSGAGVAGLVGCTNQFNGMASVVTIENCGNEATVTGVENVAGLLGGVYNNDDNVVNINNCYNTGAITGNKYSASASIVGWTRKHTNIRNTYNIGTVGGTDDWLTFACTKSSGFDGTITNCYTTVAGDQTSNVTKISSLFVESGDLCALLNKDGNVFTQTLGTDKYPIPGTEGLIGNPSDFWVEVSTAEELKTAVESTDASGNHSAKIKIISDIDLSTLSAISSGDQEGYLFTTFQGNIVGQNHKLTNSTHGMFYSLSGATIEDVVLEGFKVTDQPSLIARTSGSTKFSYITVKNSSIVHTSDDMNNYGMITGWSNYDDISYCTVESDCNITTNRQKIGGIAGQAFNGKISYCRNSATITGDADYIGGIVGISGDSSTGKASTIEYCLNTGTINGDDICGGIAGQYYNGTMSHNVNIGTVTSKDGDNHDNTGGIVGKLCSATCNNNVNFGSVVKAKSANSQFAIYGGKDGTITATDNDYYCDVKGSHLDNGILIDDINSGKYAFTKNSNSSTDRDWLYQDIDNGTYTITKYPVPFAEAGTVYSNILCDGTQSYSNKYQSTGAHESVTDVNGYCTVCGKYVGYVHITDADILCQFAEAVNSGRDYSTATVYLDNDIDMTGVTNFTPIGSGDYPYSGIFDGQGYRIKNLAITGDSYTGFFGLVGGDNKTVNIKNVIIDSSCSNTSTGTGVAGLIGCVTSTSGKTCNVTIENCGNEAAVKADRNVGGILGGVFNNSTTVVTLNNCYNTGAVTGRTLVSALGYVRKNYTITNCYNSGTLTATNNTPSLYRTDETGGTISVENCYDITGTQDGVTKITADNVASGELCFWLNGNKAAGVWGHTCDDTHPVLSGAGMQHYSRTMENQWGTICLPFATETGDDYDFYELSSVSEDVITLTKVEALAAGEPAIVYRSSSATGIDMSAVSTTFADAPIEGSSANGLILTGTFTSEKISGKDGYFISNNAFWNISGSSDLYCDSFRAYLAGTLSNGSMTLTIGGGDDKTAVDALNAITEGEAEYYDLSGHKLNNLQKGINIVKFSNGVTKKIIIK